jgi:phosphate transport system substrate-binding protein
MRQHQGEHLPVSRHIMSMNAVVVLLALLSGCAASATTARRPMPPCSVSLHDLRLGTGGPSMAPSSSSFKGQRILIDGAESFQPLVTAATTAFNAANGTHLSVVGNGSGHGLADVEAGEVQLGAADFSWQDSPNAAYYADLVDHPIAVVVFSLIVSQDLRGPIMNLTTEQIADIFSRIDTNWQQVGGTNEPISAIVAINSGADVILGKYALHGMISILPYGGATGIVGEPRSMSDAVRMVAFSKGAIGLASTSFLLNSPYGSNIIPICIDGYKPTVQDINSGHYLFWSYAHIYSKGSPGPLATAFLHYVTSPAFQSSELPAYGLLPIDQLTAQALATHPLPAGAI